MLDAAPGDFVELVGFLQDITNERLSLDLVVVSAFQVAGQRILVPQLAEPNRVPPESPAVTVSAGTRRCQGSDEFESGIEHAPEDRQPELRRLLAWARALERTGLTHLVTSIGTGRWVLNLRLPGQNRGMISLWNEGAHHWRRTEPFSRSTHRMRCPPWILRGRARSARRRRSRSRMTTTCWH